MVKRMLIDAAHPEETRVVVISGNRLDEFDFETSTKKQLKGNIYLAKITRVEPSLQAAFVDYGGNRHGFLPFSEIHPDYYRIPVADREELLAEPPPPGDGEERREPPEAAEPAEAGEVGDGDLTPAKEHYEGESVDTVGGDEIDELTRRRRVNARNYRIQEVVSRRQIMLVQVTKEERGTKGAALTTYISLAGRYCVLMPNTPRGGGISRKITNPADRKRLKEILEELDIPPGMAVIMRTAGMERSKAEIKRDYDYLLRLWDEIREKTLQSTAPALIHEEANLIKRSIRDLYSRDITEIYVEGEEGYRTAKEFMRTLIPSHAKRVKRYRDPTIPLFHRYQVETQIDDMHSPVVRLKSGGYIVINPTEALVAIDVNSGRATRERNIEETARRTNLEAAEEIARQLRLRDLAGLIVIDFIDMEDARNRQRVEKRLKEAMKNDRARIQLGRISPFGLLELSRQRLRPSLMETSTEVCPLCGGSGHVRSTESTALHVLRAIEEEGMRKRSREITVSVPDEVALYVLNRKRAALNDIEARYGFRVSIAADNTLVPSDMRIDRVTGRPALGEEAVPESPAAEAPEAAEEEGPKRRRGRGRRRRAAAGEDAGAREAGEAVAETETESATEAETEPGDAVEAAEAGKAEQPARKRRRGKRGGRRRGRRAATDETGPAEAEGGDSPDADEAIAASAADGSVQEAQEVQEQDETLSESPEAPAESRPARAPRRRRATRKARTEITPDAPAQAGAQAEAEASHPSANDDAGSHEGQDDVHREAAVPEASEPGAGAMADQQGLGAAGLHDSETPFIAEEQKSESSEDRSREGRRGWWNRLVQ